MRDFKVWAVCECGDRKIPAFGDLWFTSKGVCEECGAWNSRRVRRVERWVSTGRLFSPSTWGSGYWQTPEDAARPTTGDKA